MRNFFDAQCYYRHTGHFYFASPELTTQSHADVWCRIDVIDEYTYSEFS